MYSPKPFSYPLQKQMQMSFTPSKYQLDIYHAVQNETCHLLIDAKAGSGKTTTIVNALQYIAKDKKILMGAFNASIRDELRSRVSAHVDVKTSHQLGKSVLSRKYRLPVDTKGKKLKDALLYCAVQWGWAVQGSKGYYIEKDFQDNEKVVKKLANLCRMKMQFKPDEVRLIAEHYNLEITEQEEHLKVIEVLRKMCDKHTMIDFADMLFLPLIDKQAVFPQYDWILVDEAQDLNAAQLQLYQKCLAPSGRMVFVGDPRQAIYGFMGADANSFNNIASIPNMKQLPLNECYRCGKKIIEYVNRLVPEITAFESNTEGEVRDGSVDEVQDGDFVLCRNNFPLVKLCYKFLGEGKRAALKGKDVAKSIVALVRKYRRKDLQGLEPFLHTHLNRKLQRLRQMYPQDEIQDLKERNQYVIADETVNIILLILAENPSIADTKQLIEAIESLFNDDTKDGIILSSVHKSKGLEAERVFILEKELMPSKYAEQAWELEQEKNLQYVAYTRAKDALIFIDDWNSKDSDEEGTQEAVEASSMDFDGFLKTL